MTPADAKRFGENPLLTFRANLAAVEERITRACKRAGRDRASVRLLPITKTVPANVLRFAAEAGIQSFGENKIQEAVSKRDALSDLRIDWSIVGHLQTNKVKFLTGFACEFHALDSLRLANLLNARLEQAGRILDVYVQVNTSGEESKYGLHPDELIPFIEKLEQFPRLRPRGVMTLAVFSSDMEKVRSCFRLLRRLRDEVVMRNAAMAELSMGKEMPLAAVTGCVLDDTVKGHVETVACAAGSFARSAVERLPIRPCGTGDLFTALLVAGLCYGKTLVEAAAKATEEVFRVLQATLAAKSNEMLLTGFSARSALSQEVNHERF